MAIFDGFDEELFNEFESSNKESFDDMALDHEGKDKIQSELTKDKLRPKPRVDYSDFSNHVFFGSAYWAVNFFLSRLYDPDNGYPWDGELKDVNNWRSLNSEFENWFFDNVWPKQIGHVDFFSGASASENYIDATDHRGFLNPKTGSFTVELHTDPWDNFSGLNPLCDYSDAAREDGFSLYFKKQGSEKNLHFAIYSASIEENLTASFDAVLSGGHHIAATYDAENQKQILYLDGDFFLSRSLGTTFDEVNVRSGNFEVGAIKNGTQTYSGSIEEVRYWLGKRSSELIKRDHKKSIYANISGGLRLYYRFSELADVSPPESVIDYSGFEIHGEFVNDFTVANKVSGTFLEGFQDAGSPILNRSNTQVSAALATWYESGSAYDNQNRNLIFNLVPSFYVDQDQHDDMRLFLLLIARHYDRLKLYTQHLSNYLFSDESEFNNSPDKLLDILARNYGMELGGVYEGTQPLEYLFGESVLTSSVANTLDNSLESIRNQLRRNLVNNLSYIIKTKSTRESIQSAIRALGIDSDVVNINEYSRLSGGIETTYHDKVVERRVANFTTSSNVFVDKSVYSNADPRSYQVRVLFDTGSSYLTSSIFSIRDSGGSIFRLDVERENLTSSKGTAKLHLNSAAGSPVTSSLLRLYDNEWVNFTVHREVPGVGATFGLNVSRFFRDEVDFHFSGTGDASGGDNPAATNVDVVLGSSGSNYFDGKMQEFRAWDGLLTSSALIEKHTRDFESLALNNFLDDLDSLLLSHLKLNDHTGSTTGGGPIHDYLDGLSGSSYLGFSSSADFNFPGEYIYKQEQSYSYDFGINNNKIRIRNTDEVLKGDVVEDIPYLSVDVSPITALNKEIIKWFGDLEKFNDLIGQPYNKYRDDISELGAYRNKFFNERLSSKVDYSSYLNLLKWFDSNFSFFLSQLVPLDSVKSISNFTIEPHLFEYNKVEHQFPFSKGNKSRTIDANTTFSISPTASTTGYFSNIGDIDPGRFGAAVSASAFNEASNNIVYPLSTSNGVNYNDRQQRRTLSDFLRDSTSYSSSVGNGYYTVTIEDKNHLKNTYGVTDLAIDRISEHHFDRDTYLKTKYIPENTFYTGTLPLVLDQRWLYFDFVKDVVLLPGEDMIGPPIDLGWKYGGGAGQLFYFTQKSLYTTPWDYRKGFPPVTDIGRQTQVSLSEIRPVVESAEVYGDNKVVYLWPSATSFRGQVVEATGLTGSVKESGINASFFGDVVNVDGFSKVNLIINAERVRQPASSGQDPLIEVTVRYQFFNDSLVGSFGHQSAFSSSVSYSGAGVGKVTKYQQQEETFFQQSVPVNSEDGIQFLEEKDLLGTKFMRVFVQVSYPYYLNNDAPWRFTVKGLLIK